MESPHGSFHEPPWHAPLDPELVFARIPAHAKIKGVYLEAIASAARDDGVQLPSARPSYTTFRDYPLIEHCKLLVEAARLRWPDRSLRHGLRSLGRGAPVALMGSMVGRVTVGSVEGPLETLRAMGKTYSLILDPSRVTVTEGQAGRAVLELRDIPFFLDCHHVGVFEGTLKYAGVPKPRVRIRDLSSSAADLLCEWDAR